MQPVATKTLRASIKAEKLNETGLPMGKRSPFYKMLVEGDKGIVEAGKQVG